MIDMIEGQAGIDPGLEEMLTAYRGSGSTLTSSRYWVELSGKHIRDLKERGYENFKQTLAMHYFTVVPKPGDPQVQYLEGQLSPLEVMAARARSYFGRNHTIIGPARSRWFNYVTYLLWQHVRKIAGKGIDGIEEPLEGNPLSARLKGREISQDIAHSMLEFESIRRGIGDVSKIGRMIELGAGYGRTAFVFMRRVPGLKYVIVDIPPALYVSQRYLSSVLPGRKVFKFRPFDSFQTVEKEFNEADLAFLMPAQLELLPAGTADLFVAIDSLHEMRPEQIAGYFDLVNRVTKHFFYFKCWKKTKIPYDDIVLTEADYPVKSDWKKIFWRDCDVLTLPTSFDGKKVTAKYFEALCRLC